MFLSDDGVLIANNKRMNHTHSLHKQGLQKGLRSIIDIENRIEKQGSVPLSTS